jgi:hypothetical protein
MAQRLLFFAAVVVGLVVIVGPGAMVGGVLAFTLYSFSGSPLVFVPGALTCLVIVAVEIILLTEALGPLYERIDLSGVERSEYGG